MSTPTLWLTIAGVAGVTFALRLSFIVLLGRIEIPPFLKRALRYVPAAVLTAVVIPLLFYADGSLEFSLGNERLVAGLVAALICWRTRSVPLTLVGGMAMLWALQAIGQSL
jgi:branched-subunit amino acid transport protein